MADFPEFMAGVFASIGLAQEQTKYVCAGTHEHAGSSDPEMYLASQGFLTCGSIAMHFPDIRSAVMSHHNPAEPNPDKPDPEKTLSGVVESIAESHPHLTGLSGWYALFHGSVYTPSAKEIIRSVFPNLDSALGFVELHDILVMEKETGRIRKYANPFFFE